MYINQRKQLTHFGVQQLGNSRVNVLFKETKNLFDFNLEKFKWITNKSDIIATHIRYH